MAEEDGERTLPASQRKLDQARERGDVPISREGASAGLYVGVLIAVALTGPASARRVGDIILPLIEQPDAFVGLGRDGLLLAGKSAGEALMIAVAPFFCAAVAGGLVPHIMQNSVAFSAERLMPKLSHFSPAGAVKRVFGARGLFEFAKSLVKMLAVGVVCYSVGKPLYVNSVGLVAVDLAAFPRMMSEAIVSLLLAVTLVAIVVAGIDVPYQHWAYGRRQRMSLQEMKEEMRSTEGDPHAKGKRARLRRQRSQRRMMRDLKRASVAIVNPTHFAVALRYERGVDAAPVVVAKGMDHLALRIRALCAGQGIAVVEDRPLARALHAAVEIGQTIPKEHFEAVAKIVALVWAQRAGGGITERAGGGVTERAASATAPGQVAGPA